MAKTISKTMTITRVTYKTVEVVDGEARFVDHPDAVFSGILEKDKVERMLRGQLGKDAIIVVTAVDSGQHRYEMDLDAFVLNARIADGEPEEAQDGENAPDAALESVSKTDSASEDTELSAPVPEAESAGNAPESVPSPDPAPAPNGDDGDESEDEKDPF